MDSLFDKLVSFYKAQAIKDPVALATYVTRRYGSMDKFAMARGMVGKRNAKKWNPVKNTAGSKTGKSANAPKGGPSQPKLTAGKGQDRQTYGKRTARERKGGATAEPKTETSFTDSKGRVKRSRTGGGTRSKEGGYGTLSSWTGGTKKSIGLDKAQSIEDSRELASHLSRQAKGSSGQLWHGGEAGPGSWVRYEGGIRGKANAKEWNPLIGGDTDEKGKKYNLTTGEVIREKKKKEPQARLGGKFASRGKAGKSEPHYQPAMKIGGKRIGDKKEKSIEKSFDILLKAKFGGKPLGWDDLPRDPIAFATNVLNHKGYWYSNIKAGTKGAKMRNNLSQGIRALVNKIPESSAKEKKQGKIQDDKYRDEAKRLAEEMEDSWKKGERPDVKVEKQAMPPALARILGFGAGWAMSDTFVEAPRGQLPPSQQRDWERLVRSAMRRKKDLRKDGIDSLQSYYNDSSDTYIKRTPNENALVVSKTIADSDEAKKMTERMLEKEHAPIPPRQGLVWDEQKKHWTRQEHVGHTVAEVQGKKRVRGTGTGVHERTKAGAGGKGAGMSAVAGRRFRSAADAGVIKPHEAKHPATRPHADTKKKLLQHLRGRAGTVRTVH